MIKKVIRLINKTFSPRKIFEALFYIADDSALEELPGIDSMIKKLDENPKINNKALNEIISYFNQEGDKEKKEFFNFIGLFISEEGLENLDKEEEDDFISFLNYIIKNSNLIVQDNRIQKIVVLKKPFKYPFDYLLLHIDTPDHVYDYYSEALHCMLSGTYRSSILFSVFAFEASLKCIRVKQGLSPKKSLEDLIKWAIDNQLLEINEYKGSEWEKLKKYRNRLVHCGPIDVPYITHDKAENRLLADLNLVNQSINSVFS
jgi:hypothetical protein